MLFIKGAIPGGRNSLVKIITDGELTFVENISKEEMAPVAEELIEEKVEETVVAPEVETEVKEEVNTEAEVSAETK